MADPIDNTPTVLFSPNAYRTTPPERVSSSFGTHIAEQLSCLSGSVAEYMWTIQHQLDALNLSEEDSSIARQRIVDRTASVMEYTAPQIRATNLSVFDDDITLTINIPRSHILGSLNRVLSSYPPTFQQPPMMAFHNAPAPCPMPYQTAPAFPPASYQNYASQPFVSGGQFASRPSVNFPHAQQQAFVPTQNMTFSQVPGPQQSYIPGPQPPAPQTQPPHSRPPTSFEGGASFSISSPSSHHIAHLTGRSSMAPSQHGPEQLVGNLAGGFMDPMLLNLMSMPAVSSQTASQSGPQGIERLLCTISTSHPVFKEMKDLMVIRENPLQCFEQSHLVEQWTQRVNEVEIIQNAMARKTDHFKGVNFAEFMKKPPEEQGPFLLKSLLSKPDNESNIQMVAFLKQHNFLKRVEPNSPTIDAGRSPEGSNTPSRSNTPTTGTALAMGALDRTSTDTTGNRSDPENLSESGLHSGLRDSDNDEAV